MSLQEIQIHVKPFDENNIDGVLELLNSHKNNLSILLLQYNTIIQTYLKILGINLKHLSNVNEVIVPEIENLLNKYDCKFTENGIYSSKEQIFSVDTKNSVIQIKDGENNCEIKSCLAHSGQYSLVVRKCIVDFSNLDKDTKKILSNFANIQLDSNSKFYFPLQNISIQSLISHGIEISKMVREFYDAGDDKILVEQFFELDVDSPTINYVQNVVVPDKLEKENLRKNMIKIGNRKFGKTKEQHQLILKTCNNFGIPALAGSYTDEEKLFYYGKSRLYLKGNQVHEPRGDNIYIGLGNIGNIEGRKRFKDELAKDISSIDKFMDRDEKKVKTYDIFKLLGYNKLINNIKTYNRKYPHNFHPIYLYMRDWKDELGIFVKKYIQAMNELYL